MSDVSFSDLAALRQELNPQELRSRLRATLTLGPGELIPVVVQEIATREVLMLAWMDVEALARTIETHLATYWSRSRQSYWVKGETSGHWQNVARISLDCDADTVLLEVSQTGPACHAGTVTCFSERHIYADHLV